MPPKTERFEMRWDSDMLAAIDRWRKSMGGESRAEAIRTLIRIGLVARDVSLAEIASALDPPPERKKKRVTKY